MTTSYMTYRISKTAASKAPVAAADARAILERDWKPEYWKLIAISEQDAHWMVQFDVEVGNWEYSRGSHD